MRAENQRKKRTLLRVAVANVGLRRGYGAVGFIVCWGIVEYALGRTPTVEEYADWWNESRSTVYRQQANFRKAFPGETTPARIVALLREQREDWTRDGVPGAAEMWVSGVRTA